MFGPMWVRRVGMVLLGGGLSLCCDPLLSTREPAVAGDNPSVNRATAARQDVPYCRGGDRDQGCVLGTNCRVTQDGCQVCQCNTPR